MNDHLSHHQIDIEIGDNAHVIAAGDRIMQTVNITNNYNSTPSTTSSPNVTNATETEKRYRDRVVERYNHMALTGLSAQPVSLTALPLEDIFIMLDVEVKQAEVAETLSVARVLQRYRRIVIAGTPGSGKTTLLNWLAVTCASRHPIHQATFGVSIDDTYLPVLIELRFFAKRLSTVGSFNFVKQLAADIHDAYDIPTDFIVDALAAGRCLLLLDGLDEMPVHQRIILLNALRSLHAMTEQQYSENVILLSTRPHIYQEIDLGNSFRRCMIKPFSSEQVFAFVRKWYAGSANEGSIVSVTEADHLCKVIQATPALLALATNPLLCRMIITVYNNEKILPDRRAELYEKCCKTLLHHWESAKGVQLSKVVGDEDRWLIALERLKPLAFWLHSEEGRFVAPQAEWLGQLTQQLQGNSKTANENALYEAQSFLRAICERSGLLQYAAGSSLQDENNRWLQFVHPTFQEYLAARYIADQSESNCIDLVMKELHKAWWREVHLLTIGHLGRKDCLSEDAKIVAKLLQTILHCTSAPWPWLRAFAQSTQAPKWVGKLVERFGENRRLQGPIRVICSLLLLPTLFVRLLSTWQLSQQLEWSLQRNFTLAAVGFLECTDKGRTPTLKTVIQAAATQRLLVAKFYNYWNGSYTDASDPIKFLIKLFHLPLEQNLVKKLLQMLKGQDEWARIHAIISLGQLGQAAPEVVNSLQIELPAIVEALQIILKGTNRYQSHLAATSLGQLKQVTPDVIMGLLNILNPAPYYLSEPKRRFTVVGEQEEW